MSNVAGCQGLIFPSSTHVDKSITLSATPNISALNHDQTVIISITSEEWKDADLQWRVVSDELEAVGELSSAVETSVVYRAPSYGRGIVTVSLSGTVDSTIGIANISFHIDLPLIEQRPLSELKVISDSSPLLLAFVYGDVSNSDILVANLGNGEVKTIAGQTCDAAESSWSPNATQIIYQANCNGTYDIYQVNSDGSSQRQLTFTNNMDEREPDYSSDGKLIAFRTNPANQGKAGNGDLWVMKADGSDLQFLKIRGRSPQWSPDNSQIAFMSQTGDIWNIYIYEVATGNMRQLTNCKTNCRWPTWSPDGQTIIFNTTTDSDTTIADAIWSISALGGDMKRLSQGNNAGRASWSANELIAFNSADGIEYMHSDGSGRTLLIRSDANWAPRWSK